MHRSCLTDADAPQLEALIDEYNRRCGDGNASAAPFVRYFADLASACDRVACPDVNGMLDDDVRPWLNRLTSIRTMAGVVGAVLAMGTGEMPVDMNAVRRLRREGLRLIDGLRARYAPHIGHRAIVGLTLRAMAVSEDILRADLDAARSMMNEPITITDW